MTVVTGLAWSDAAVRHLLDPTLCPSCRAAPLHDGRCPHCGVDLSGPAGAELWAASQAAAAALRAREAVLSRVPHVAPGTVAATVQAAGSLPPVLPPVPPTPAAVPARSSATVQSVLAVAGAGLFAIAAIVFTFFNPEFTDRGVRALVIVAVTLVFLGGARLLVRAGLRFSAEAVGALGMVFLALDVHALTEAVPASPWLTAAAGTLVAGALMTGLAVRWGIRVWLWLSFAGLSAVPAMVGASAGAPLGTAIGWLGAAAAASALFEATRTLAHRFDGRLQAERVLLTVIVFLSVAALLAVLPRLGATGGFWTGATGLWGTVAVLLAASSGLALLATRQLLPRVWAVLAGALGTIALATAALASESPALDPALFPLFVIPAAAIVAAIALGALLPLPRSADRRFVRGGALGVAALTILPPLGASLGTGAAAVIGGRAIPVISDAGMWFTVAGLTAIAAGLGTFARLSGLRWLGQLGTWFAMAAALTVVAHPAVPLAARLVLGLGFAVAATAVAVRLRRAASRLPLVVSAHLAGVLCALLSWRDPAFAVWVGVAVVAAIAVVARGVPPVLRFLHVGVGYAYALAVFARGLALVGVDVVPALCLTTSLAALGAIGATYLRRVGPRSWWAILAVTTVPFLIGVAQVVVERSAWTALSTGVTFLLALALALTRRPGLGAPLRAISAGLLVPSLAVVVVCLGAQLLPGSGSPVVLPVVAAIVAAALPATEACRDALVRHGIPGGDAAAARLALEASALLTGAIAVALGLVRQAAGLGTTLLVLVILGIGAAAAARWGGRRYGWWLAGAAFTGALWCAWGIAGIVVLEPYLLPPAIGAALVGAILVARGGHRGAVGLFATGLAVATVPVLLVLAGSGPAGAGSVGAGLAGSAGFAGPAGLAAWRAAGLLGSSWLLLVLGGLLREPRVRALRAPALAVAVVTGAAGAVYGVHLGLAATSTAIPLVLVCAGLGLAGAVPASLAGRMLRRTARAGSPLARTRWLQAPALLYVASAVWSPIARDWFVVWTVYALLLALLGLLVIVAARQRTRDTGMPPVWFVFAVAFATAVVAWSPRDLRVEVFSLPLGAALLAAGVLHLRRTRGTPTLNAWPAGFTGSWPLLLPGLLVLFSASMTATFTDPLTWRAIVVIVLALVAILVGATAKLAAPFVVGIVVLPIENALVFLVQIGRGVASMPWWITLAVVGAVLLIIAVTYERRADTGIAARLRDLS